MNKILIKEVTVKAMLKDQKNYFRFTPSVQGEAMFAEVIEHMKRMSITSVKLPLIGTGSNGKEYKLGVKSDSILPLLLNNNNIKIEEDKIMTNSTTTNNAQVTMTQDQWTQVMMENAAKYVTDSKIDRAIEKMDGADETNVIDKLKYAVCTAAVATADAINGQKIIDTLTLITNDAKAKGTEALAKISAIAMVAWRKISAAIVGLGYFGFHAVGVILNHSIAAGKELVTLFNEDVIQRVKNA